MQSEPGGVNFLRLDSPDPASARNVEIGEAELAHFHSLSWTETARTLPASRVVLTPPPVLAPDAPPVPVAPVRRSQGPPTPAPGAGGSTPAAGLLAGGAGRPGAAVLTAGLVQHRLPGRGPLPVGGPAGVAALAARDAAAGPAGLLFRCARRLPAARRGGGRGLGAGRRARAVAGLHARSELPAVGDYRPADGEAGRVLRDRDVGVLGPVQRLGAFATYDAMAIFMLAVAAWCAVRAAASRTYVRWLLAAAAATVLANAAKYASAIFDRSSSGWSGWRPARGRAASGPRPGGRSCSPTWPPRSSRCC